MTARKNDPGVATNMRLPRELHDRLVQAAAEREVSVNWLAKRAIEHYLDRLIPVDEMKWIRDADIPR